MRLLTDGTAVRSRGKKIFIQIILKYINKTLGWLVAIIGHKKLGKLLGLDKDSSNCSKGNWIMHPCLERNTRGTNNPAQSVNGPGRLGCSMLASLTLTEI